MQTITAAISDDHHPPDSRNVCFNNIDTMTDGITVRPKSIFYDGARLNDLHPSVRSDLDSLIVSSKAGRKPVAPNLFLESKPLSRGTQVTVRKARLDGAYDGNEYTFSFVYNAVNSALKIYAHWVTAPATPGGRPDYI